VRSPLPTLHPRPRGRRRTAQTYSVVDKVIVEKIEGSTWPNWNGTEQKRPIISFTGDDMKTSTPAASVGGTAENTYKRIK
jgi:hypothetical protein